MLTFISNFVQGLKLLRKVFIPPNALAREMIKYTTYTFSLLSTFVWFVWVRISVQIVATKMALYMLGIGQVYSILRHNHNVPKTMRKCVLAESVLILCSYCVHTGREHILLQQIKIPYIRSLGLNCY